MENQEEDRIYINVPFAEKEEAKAIGACWDADRKSWYIPIDLDLSEETFAKWLTEIEKIEAIETEFLCEECGSVLLQRPIKKGGIWFSCSAYPDCEMKYWATKKRTPKFKNK